MEEKKKYRHKVNFSTDMPFTNGRSEYDLIDSWVYALTVYRTNAGTLQITIWPTEKVVEVPREHIAYIEKVEADEDEVEKYG